MYSLKMSNEKGENPLRCTLKRKMTSSLYYNLFFPYILIPIKTNESKSVKYFISTIFQTITILDSIIIIHKCVFTW